MASIYYLFDDALQIADDIVDKYSQQDKNLKENHYAATVIQRSYRGYIVRKAYKEYIRQVIVLQKYVRGWLVRFRLPELLQEYYDKYCLEVYNKSATKIQAAWRGKLVRNEYDVKKILEERLWNEKRADQSRTTMELFSVQEEKELQTQDEPVHESSVVVGQEKHLKERILEMMFDRHHLLSTQIHKGILQSSSELQELEKVLKVLPWKDYLKKERILYNKYKKMEEKSKYVYIFTDKEMKKQEDLLRSRDKSHDTKEILMGNCVADNRKPFDLYSKPQHGVYQKRLFCEGKFVKPIENITRSEDKSKNISGEDFSFALKEVVKRSDVPAFYADFWYKECVEHHLDE